jgi:hypothetical protein
MTAILAPPTKCPKMARQIANRVDNAHYLDAVRNRLLEDESRVDQKS